MVYLHIVQFSAVSYREPAAQVSSAPPPLSLLSYGNLCTPCLYPFFAFCCLKLKVFLTDDKGVRSDLEGRQWWLRRVITILPWFCNISTYHNQEVLIIEPCKIFRIKCASFLGISVHNSWLFVLPPPFPLFETLFHWCRGRDIDTLLLLKREVHSSMT